MDNKKHELSESTAPSGQTLRQRAESALQQSPKFTDLSPAEEQALIHELRVHQIELEMQNEQLRHAQEQLEESRDRYVELYDFAPVGYFSLDTNGLIVEANLTAVAMLGTERSRLLNKLLTRFILPGDQDIYYHHHKQLSDTRESQSVELRMTRQEGTWFYASLDETLEQDHAGNWVYRIAMSDVSQRVQAEKQKDDVLEELRKSNQRLNETLDELNQTQEKMIQQERLAAVGQLAAGAAHDFNNILSVILSYSQLMQHSPGISETMHSHLGKIGAASQRAAYLVRQLLDFSRKSAQQTRLLDLAALMIETITFLERTIPENIQISLSVVSDGYWIDADPSQLQQVMINLALNARDAMPSGGILEFRLSHVEVVGEEMCVTCGQSIQGKWVSLIVVDTGCGISPSILPRIFEPFFTTKALDRGMGLGLSQVYGIVKQHIGHIVVTSQVEKGATINIFLPLASHSAQEGTAAGTVSAEPISVHGEVLLLVEDEPTVLEASKIMPEYLNYFAHMGEKKAKLIEEGVMSCFQKLGPLKQLSQVVHQAIPTNWDPFGGGFAHRPNPGSGVRPRVDTAA